MIGMWRRSRSEEEREANRRIAERDRKARGAEKLRAALSHQDIEEEESRLIFEARRLARKLGLSETGIGDGWWRTPDGVELNHDGQLSAFRISESEVA